MDLRNAGIVLTCRCGAEMAADITQVLFQDKGRVKVGNTPIVCPRCGAIYRFGERIRYHLLPLEPLSTSYARGVTIL